MKDKKFFNWLIIFLGVVAIIGFCFTPAFADEITSPMTGIQQEDDSISAPPLEDPEIFDDSFGEEYQFTWVPSAAFIPQQDGVFYQLRGYKYRMSGSGFAVAPVNLPSGAFLNAVAFFFYDDNSSYYVTSYLYRYYWLDSTQSLGTCGSFGTPGYSLCTFYPNHTIQNGASVYQLWVNTNSTNSSCRFMGVRLYWKRQIHYGLAHPFNDIGGLSTEFQASIAALYQSGITTGTSSTTFSPNNYVTRGQMATFLARALGLYWGNPY